MKGSRISPKVRRGGPRGKRYLNRDIIYDAGADLLDIVSRNIYILDSDYDGSDVPLNERHAEAKIFDFNIAQVMTHPHAAHSKYEPPLALRRNSWPSKLLYPIERYYGLMMEFSTNDWCSNDVGAPEKWLWQHFHDDHRFAPVIWDPDLPNEYPEYQELLQYQQGSVVEHGGSSTSAKLTEHVDNGHDSHCAKVSTASSTKADAKVQD
jgi:hypothetical protein